MVQPWYPVLFVAFESHSNYSYFIYIFIQGIKKKKKRDALRDTARRERLAEPLSSVERRVISLVEEAGLASPGLPGRQEGGISLRHLMGRLQHLHEESVDGRVPDELEKEQVL